MPPASSRILNAQIRSINLAVVTDRVVDLYALQFWGFGKVNWSSIPQFPNQDLEHLLAKVQFRIAASKRREHALVYLVRGHVFEIVYSFLLDKSNLSIDELGSVDVKISADTVCSARFVSPERPSALTIPKCLIDMTPEHTHRHIIRAFVPLPENLITAKLAQVFNQYPADFEKLLLCTDGLLFDIGTIYGIEELRKVPVGATDCNVIGEITLNKINGILAFEFSGNQLSYYWTDYDAAEKVALGDSLTGALCTLVGEP